MYDILEVEGRNPDHADADCFICIICSHGTREGIYGTDGKILKIEDVTRFFNGHHCPALIEKPKLFFIQACQGGMFNSLLLVIILYLHVANSAICRQQHAYSILHTFYDPAIKSLGYIHVFVCLRVCLYSKYF